MAVFPVQAISQDDVKVKFKEPYVSSALNRRFTGLPLGIYRGWTATATGPLELTLTPDVTFNDNVGMVEAPNAFGMHVRTTGGVVMDFTSHTVWPVFVVLEVGYTPPPGGTTTAQIKTVVTPIYPSQVKICKVDKPGASIVVTAVIPADRQEPFAFAGVTAGFMPGGSIEQLQAAVLTTNEVVAARTGFLSTFPNLDARLDAELAAGGIDGMATRLAKDAKPVLGTRVSTANLPWWSGLGSSVNVSLDFKTIEPGGSASVKGVVTGPPDNLVFLRDTDSDELFDSLGRLIYGRLTYAPIILTDDATPGISFTNGLDTVVGTGTLFLTELALGDLLEGPDGDFHVVESIVDDFNLVLVDVYPSATAAITGAERRRFTLTFYTLVGGVDTVLTFSASQTFDYYFHQVFDAADRPFQSDVIKNFRRGRAAGDMPVGTATVAGKSLLIVDGATETSDGALGTLDARTGAIRSDTNVLTAGTLVTPTGYKKGLKVVQGSNITLVVTETATHIEISFNVPTGAGAGGSSAYVSVPPADGGAGSAGSTPTEFAQGNHQHPVSSAYMSASTPTLLVGAGSFATAATFNITPGFVPKLIYIGGRVSVAMCLGFAITGTQFSVTTADAGFFWGGPVPVSAIQSYEISGSGAYDFTAGALANPTVITRSGALAGTANGWWFALGGQN